MGFGMRRDFGPREMHVVACSSCGKDAHIPFRPAEGRAALCRECYQAVRNARLDSLPPADPLPDVEISGIVDANGEIPKSPDRVPEHVKVVVAGVNDAILEEYRSHPDRMRDLSGRAFEELVAELLRRQGYCTELTPPTSDGGFDILAAKSDGLGRFLYLVECKNWAPSKRVGVNVVRSLYGVVQEKRATAGIVCTTSFFTKSAQEFQRAIEYQLKLKDYIQIQEWLLTV